MLTALHHTSLVPSSLQLCLHIPYKDRPCDYIKYVYFSIHICMYVNTFLHMHMSTLKSFVLIILVLRSASLLSSTLSFLQTVPRYCLYFVNLYLFVFVFSYLVFYLTFLPFTCTFADYYYYLSLPFGTIHYPRSQRNKQNKRDAKFIKNKIKLKKS